MFLFSPLRMLKKTHLAIGISLALYFLPFVKNKLFFIPVVLIASLLPDVDSISSNIGRRRFLPPVQTILRHRGPLHSYTICIVISLIFASYAPILALPFFLGYSFHLLADSFTVSGIRPFWPLKYQTSGIVRTGSLIDRTVFWTFVVMDIFLVILIFLTT